MRTLLAVTLLASVVASGGGCGRDEVAADRAGATIEALPGVRAAALTDAEIDTELFERTIIVDLDPEVTAEETAAVLRAVAGSDAERVAVYLDAGTTENVSGSWSEPVNEIWGHPLETTSPLAEMAQLLVAGTDALAPATIRIGERDENPAPRLEVHTADLDPHQVTAALESLAGDPRLRGVAEASISSIEDLPGHRPARYQVIATGTISAEHVTAWRRIAARVDTMPTASSSGAGLQRVALDVGPGYPDQVRLDLELSQRIRPEDLTTRAWGGRLWPLIRPVLDAARPLSGTRVVVTDGFGNTFLSTTVGAGRPRPDRLGRTWSRDAAAYLTR